MIGAKFKKMGHVTVYIPQTVFCLHTSSYVCYKPQLGLTQVLEYYSSSELFE